MQGTRSDNVLLLVSPMPVIERPGGDVVLTTKFIDGMNEYAKLWPGNIRVVAPRAEQRDTNLDHVEVRREDLSFGVEAVAFDRASLAEQVGRSAVVLAGLVNEQVMLGEICQQAGVPLVYISEYDLLTRLQIADANASNPLIRLRRRMWERGAERRYRRAVAFAAGVQCNGTPTYEAYRGINPRPMLFYDNRITPDLLAPPEALAVRNRELLAGGRLRLAFSGRLVPMKGAGDLPLVAARLVELGVDFTIDICGGGSDESMIRERAASLGVQDRIRLRGVLDFKAELVPFLTRSADLFVCCHKQGDPSCTYIETMACGTPIVGYDNNAWRGMAAACKTGYVTPLNQPRAMAERIAELNRDRPALVAAGAASREVARQHLFGPTMAARIEHVKLCAGGAGGRAGSAED